MHDIEYIRKNPELFAEAIKNRGVNLSIIDEILQADHDNRSLIAHLQNLHKQRNENSEKIRKIKANKGMCKSEIELSKTITDKIEKISLKQNEKKSKLLEMLGNLPNISEDNIPIGKNEDFNLEMRKCGNAKQFYFTPKSHYELGEKLGLMNFKQAAQISGSRFSILQGKLAQMGRALINFMLDLHVNEFGYTEIYHPALVKDEAMYNVGQLPKFYDESYITKDNLRLIPTSEVVLTNLVAGRVINDDILPMRFTAYSECFRKEAGSAGKDTKGMIRQHQFGKVELVSITSDNQSNIELERMTSIAEEILKRLELPYRIVLLCSGDMGFAAQKTYDIEVWLPGQNKYREISSCSNCGAFQARRMNTKYKASSDNKTKKYVHTLNGSALAIGRTIVAIMENYQNSDQTITIPSILQKYIGCERLKYN